MIQKLTFSDAEADTKGSQNQTDYGYQYGDRGSE